MSNTKTMQEYYGALDRLIKNKPNIVPKGSKINNDTVALEAGKKRGAIRTDREVFIKLIEDINEVSNKEKAPIQELQLKLDKIKSEKEEYKELYQKAINREVMYIEQINELEKKLKSQR